MNIASLRHIFFMDNNSVIFFLGTALKTPHKPCSFQLEWLALHWSLSTAGKAHAVPVSDGRTEPVKKWNTLSIASGETVRKQTTIKHCWFYSDRITSADQAASHGCHISRRPECVVMRFHGCTCWCAKTVLSDALADYKAVSSGCSVQYLANTSRRSHLPFDEFSFK